MASKLFHAVVGFGIALGSASAACFGATEPGGVIAGDAGEPSSSSSSGGRAASSSSSSSSGATTSADALDATVATEDAGVDATADVAVDPFCDNAWPTTKGNPGPPTCTDPAGECADAGAPERCYALGDGGTCVFFQTYAPYCISGEWKCTGGTMPYEDCPQ